MSVGGTVDNGVDVGSGALVGVALGGLSVGGTLVGCGVDVGSGVSVGNTRVACRVAVARGVLVGRVTPVGVCAGNAVEALRVAVRICATAFGVAVYIGSGIRPTAGAVAPRPTGVSKLLRFQAGGVRTSGRSGSMTTLGCAP